MTSLARDIAIASTVERAAEGDELAFAREALPATPAGSGQVRAWLFDCEITSANRDVAGRQLVLINADLHPDTTASLWGTTLIWNEQGTWDGSWTGSADAAWPGSGRTWSGSLVGSGAYQGMQYRVVATTRDGVDLSIDGWLSATD